MEKKKNSSRFIIPPSYFKRVGIKPVIVSNPKNSTVTSTKHVVDIKKDTVVAPTTKPVAIPENSKPKIILNSKTKRSSGLSLSSIRAKKEHEIKQMNVVVDEEDLPREPFFQEELTEVWNTFVLQIEDEGKMNLASILSIDKPKLIGTEIHLTFPNSTNKVEVERQSFDLLQFLRKKLKNYDISLKIDVNEEMQKKFAYTPDEKYEKLKEKNPNIELLRKTFDLDL